MAPLLLELSNLDVESLETSVNAPEQEKSLETLVEGEVAALLIPLNGDGDDPPIPPFIPCCGFCDFGN